MTDLFRTINGEWMVRDKRRMPSGIRPVRRWHPRDQWAMWRAQRRCR